jgi:adenylylsulfate kinase-like enzyme
VLTRLGLFVETVTNFLKDLRREDPEAFESLDGGYTRRYLDREGYFSDAKREQARRRLPVVKIN